MTDHKDLDCAYLLLIQKELEEANAECREKQAIIERFMESERNAGKNIDSNIIKESDPNGKQPSEAGSKLDAGKPDCGLLLAFGLALNEVAKVSTYGAKKYSRGGWEHVPQGVDRYTAAMLRHLLREHGESIDQDTGLAHAAHAAWNALARLELILRENKK